MGHRRTTDTRRSLYRRFPKKLLAGAAIAGLVVLVVVGAFAIPILVDFATAVQNGNVAKWLGDVSKTAQDIVKPITDFVNSLTATAG